MKHAKLASLLPVVLLSAATALAGDAVYTEHTSTRIHTHQTRALWRPFVFVDRAWETFLHSPQILAEGIEGDRVLVNRRGILATREVPVEECIISPAD
jgi:hypothetical protein